MNNPIFDILIAGGGTAGAFAAYKIAKDFPNKNAILIEFGRPPMKRRQQISGWLGLLPNSDGKMYSNDIKNVANLTTPTKAKSASKQVKKLLKKFSNCKVIKDEGPSPSTKKKINKVGYKIQLNDYFQLYPKDIHALSKLMSEEIEMAGNVTFSFDNEVQSIVKQKNIFIVQTELQEIKCRKIIFCLGRGGWREAQHIFNQFGLIEDNNTARFGIHLEMPAHMLKDFNGSNCRIFKPEIEIGPLSWHGTVIPEDQTDYAISAFRANENRWKSDKVSFQLIGNIHAPNSGFEETNRIADLTFVWSDNRIIKEKISSIINKKSKISVFPEYNWLTDILKEFSQIVPEILTKAYFHVPTIVPLAPSINIGNNLETEINGMFVAGESAGIRGLYAAAMMGIISATAACKKEGRS